MSENIISEPSEVSTHIQPEEYDDNNISHDINNVNTSHKYAELMNKLTVARSEISNLRYKSKLTNYNLTIICINTYVYFNCRKQVNGCVLKQKKDISSILSALGNWECQLCKMQRIHGLPQPKNGIEFQPIGTISTTFKEKRGVPRQSAVGTTLQACITINQSTFTNPEHSLVGLDEFSHVWVLYYFHKNSSHTKAKISPPRLNGQRVGVFSCRSPHRPCPIGLSLIEIDRIEGPNIYFYGTDMVDGTPVLDIKPYIKQYDTPYTKNILHEDVYDEREEPDGEESVDINTLVNKPSTSQQRLEITPPSQAKEANWVQNVTKLQVLYTSVALKNILELELTADMIEEILSSDPRSVYLRTNYSSQYFTFQIGECTVTSKFDDENSTVTVLKIKKKETFDNELIV